MRGQGLENTLSRIGRDNASRFWDTFWASRSIERSRWRARYATFFLLRAWFGEDTVSRRVLLWDRSVSSTFAGMVIPYLFVFEGSPHRPLIFSIDSESKISRTGSGCIVKSFRFFVTHHWRTSCPPKNELSWMESTTIGNDGTTRTCTYK
jgi:hypothetical protein